ncbi:MAG: hypothetical protein ACXADO_06665 [Candidatus Thorarchaeota archaeon]|jgi:cephalosporin hydroxylase
MSDSSWQVIGWPYATTYGGVVSAQRADDFELWDGFFDKFEFRMFIELGTSEGGTSLYFLTKCKEQGIDFLTVDIRVKCEAEESPLGKELNLRSHRLIGDILSDSDARRKVAGIVSSDNGHPLVLYCDNGNKPQEFKFFAPLAKVGDFVIVHDWNVEISLNDVDLTGFETLFRTECNERRSPTRFFRRYRCY